MAEKQARRPGPGFTAETYELTIKALEDAKTAMVEAQTAFKAALEKAQEQVEHGLMNLKEGTYADRIGRTRCMEAQAIPEPTIAKFVDLFEMASNEVRLRVLDHLGLDAVHGEGYEGGYLDSPTLLRALADDGHNITQQALAQQLDRLVRAGLIEEVRGKGSKANRYRLSGNPYGRLLQHCLAVLHL